MDVKVFTNQLFGAIRTVIDEAREPLFAVRDICDVLGIQNTSRASARLHEEDKHKLSIHTSGGEQCLLFTNEAGLYNLVFMSRREEAIRFRRWVTAEVLPTLRKTGEYQMPEFRKVLIPRPVYLGGGFEEVDEKDYQERMPAITAEWFNQLDALEGNGEQE